MGFWGSSSDKPSRELPTDLQGYEYDYLLEYMESTIGVIRFDDSELQGKLSKFLNDEKTRIIDFYSRENMPQVYEHSRFGGWSTRPVELEVKHVGNDTYLRGSTQEDIQAIRTRLKSLGFYWDKQQRSWLLKNRKISIDEIKDFLRIRYSEGVTAGLKAYCEKIAYRQSMEGIPNTFSVSDKMDHDVGIDDKCTECGKEIPLLRRKALPSAKTCVNCSSPEDSKDKIDISESKSSDNPYSKVEQLEKLIALRNKGEISPEEFDNLKKELLS